VYNPSWGRDLCGDWGFSFSFKETWWRNGSNWWPALSPPAGRPSEDSFDANKHMRNCEMPPRNDISAACYSLLRSRVDCRARRVFRRPQHTEIRAVISLLLARMKCVMSIMLFKNQLEYRGCGRAFDFLNKPACVKIRVPACIIIRAGECLLLRLLTCISSRWNITIQDIAIKTSGQIQITNSKIIFISLVKIACKSLVALLSFSLLHSKSRSRFHYCFCSRS